MRACIAALLVAGCSLEGFSSGSTAGAGGAGGAASSTTSTGGAGGGCPPCACAGWSEEPVSDAGPAIEPSLAWTDTTWAIAWQDARHNNPEIYFSRLGGQDLRVTNDGADSFAPVLAWAGTHHAIAYEDWRTTNAGAYLALVSADGLSVLDVEVHTAPGAPIKPTVAWGGMQHAMVWSDFRNSSFELRTGLVNDMGMVDAMYTDTGSLTGANGTELAPAMVFGQFEHGLVWQDNRDGNDEIYFARLDTHGVKIGAEARVTNAAGASTTPAITWTGSGYGVVWADARSGNNEVYFVGLSEGGAVQATEVVIHAGDAPTIVWDGTGYAVAWHDTSGVSVMRLGTDGTPLGPALSIAAAGANPSIAWSGTAYGVAWQDDRTGTSAIYFASCTP